MGGGGKKSGPKDIPGEATRLADPIAFYKQQTGRYPSNAQTWWAYKRPPEPGTQEPPKLYLEVFDPAIRHQLAVGNTQVSKGHYILDAFHMDRSGASGVLGIPAVSTIHRPSCVAFYAGRVFYAGVNTFGFNTKVYFSQIIEKAAQVQLCHQQLDPTDEDYRDLLPTDGGVIVIPEMAEAKHMHVMGQSLFIFATNGVWQISGSEGIGFRANDYSVSKVSSVGTLSNMSFVDVEGVPMWWSRSGVWMLQNNPMGTASIQSLTDESIKTFFDDIPDESKIYAKGSYNPILKRVQWLYRRTISDEPLSEFFYDSILNFDVKTGAWWNYTPYETLQVKLRGIFTTEGYEYERVNEPVVSTYLSVIEPVYVDAEPVEVELVNKNLTDSRFKYIIDIMDDAAYVPAPPPIYPPAIVEVLVDEEPVFAGADPVISYEF